MKQDSKPSQKELPTPSIIKPPSKAQESGKVAKMFRLTARDEAIFKFLLDQKFATLEALYFRFFDQRKSPTEPLPKNLFVTRQRLQLLKVHGFVTTERTFTEAKSLYLLGPRGFRHLEFLGKEVAYAVPMRTVDYRNFHHDVKVTYARVALEKAGMALHWYAERRIRIQGYKVEGETLPESIVPDGIFVSSKGERVVFELECLERKKSRYEVKLRALQSLILFGLVHKVLWVAATERVGRDLLEVAGGARGILIKRYEELTNMLQPGGKW